MEHGSGPCEYQKELLEDDLDLIQPFYNECYKDKDYTTIQKCVDAELYAYPAWDLKDGREYGIIHNFDTLKKLSGCENY